jgi:SAM-dependent methyltransferase
MSGAPDVYLHGHHDSVLRSHRWRTAENSAGYLLPCLKATDALLDIGCGPGTITLDLAARLTAGTVTGIDNAPEAVDLARRRATETGLGSQPGVDASGPPRRVEFAVGDVYSLDFADASFDVVHAHQVLQHLSDPVAALVEMRRVCRPGGIVAARDADYAAMTWHPAESGLTRWLELYHQVARSNRGEPDAGRRMRSWALAAGFDRIRASASVWCFAERQDVGWWGDLWAERVTESSFGQQALDRNLTDPAELRRIASSWRTWAAAPDAWFAVLHGEVLCTV